MMDADGHVQEVDRESVQARFGVLYAATPVAALESVPTAVEDGESTTPATLRIGIVGEQSPF